MVSFFEAFFHVIADDTCSFKTRAASQSILGRGRGNITNMASSNQIKIDPLVLNGIAELMNPKTFAVYKKTWLDFINFSGINVDRRPDEADFRGYLEKKRNAGLCGNTVSTIYSHLNKFFIQLYGERLGVSQELNPSKVNPIINQPHKKPNPSKINPKLLLEMATAFYTGGFFLAWRVCEEGKNLYQRRTFAVFA